jgi:fatty-acid desaturase
MFKTLNFNFKVRTLQAINHIASVIGIIYAANTGHLSLLWYTLIMYIVMAPIGTGIGMHRLFSHKSYKTNRFWEFILGLCGSLASIGSPLAWVALHRYHHANTERPNDPHSPYVNRETNDKEKLKFNLWQAFKVWIGAWNVGYIHHRTVLDMLHDPMHNFMHKHYFKIIGAYVLLLVLINPWLVIFAYALPACLAMHATSVIIVVAHIHGYRTHDIYDNSRNSWISNLITMGDGWHNNHHANPGKWNSQEQWWEIDPYAWVIRLIKKD